MARETEGGYRRLFLDESGYTGADLLNGDQPVMCIATLELTEAECAKAKAKYFSRLAASELKYSSVSKRARYQQGVLDLLDDVLARPGAARVSLVHKRFALVAQLVDALVEPALRERGVDLYRDGVNVCLSNALFYCMPPLIGEAEWSRLLAAFQLACRQGSEEAAREFSKTLFSSQSDSGGAELMSWLRMSGPDGVCLALQEAIDVDVSLPCALALLASWASSGADMGISLVHDRSSNMARRSETWDFITARERSPFAAELGAGLAAVFPIGATTNFVDSDTSPGVQVADVVAGAFADAARWKHFRSADDPYRERLFERLNRDRAMVHSIWPSTDVDPTSLGTLEYDRGAVLEYLQAESSRTRSRHTKV